MSPTVAIIDYGSGNLRSAEKALQRAARDSHRDTTVLVTSDPAAVARADRIVLPGVGAFADCRAGLVAIDGMIDALEHAIRWKGRPLLGICVGMQLMAHLGHEHGLFEGLGWIPGHVVALEARKGAVTGENRALKSPHMGWNVLELAAPAHPMLAGFPDQTGGPHAYFVHSYCFEVDNPAHMLAKTDYGGAITAVIGRDTLIGTQFHPEKSQAVGLALLANFLRWTP